MRNYALALFFLLLSACGGGGSSSGGGQPGPTPYAGTYKGSTTAYEVGYPQTAVFSTTITISQTGLFNLHASTGTDAAVCANNFGKGNYINGNIVSFGGKTRCNLPGVGNCAVDGSAKYTFSANSVIGGMTLKVSCGDGVNGTLQYDTGANKI